MEIPIATIDTSQEYKHSEHYGIVFNCKDWKTVMLVFLYADARSQFLKVLKELTATTQEKLFAFSYKYSFTLALINNQREKFIRNMGWDIYDAYGEYLRQGALSSSHWRVTDVNKSFKLCPTYPAVRNNE
jgi:hypothetical protein